MGIVRSKIVYYKNIPSVKELCYLIKDEIQVRNPFITEYILTHGYFPQTKLDFQKEWVRIVIMDGYIGNDELPQCRDVVFIFDFDDFSTSKEFGTTISHTLKLGGVLSNHFPMIPIQDLDFEYVIEKDRMVINVCNHLPF